MRFLACALLIIATTHMTKACTAGEKRQDGPNMCFCSDDGLNWTCAPANSALLDIRSEILEEEHQVEESEETCESQLNFEPLCKACRCASNTISYYICTIVECSVYIWNDNFPLINPEEDIEYTLARKYGDASDKVICQPGRSFKHYCNLCNCNDGLVESASCMEMYCDPDVWNIDGTLKYPEKNETNQQNQSHDHKITEVDSVSHSLKPYLMDMSSLRYREAKDGSCRTGEIFMNKCNYCICGTDKTIAGALCTSIDCDLTVENKESTEKSDVTLLKNKDFVETPKDMTTSTKPHQERLQ